MMFWAITCESGKRYSQIPLEPFHVSMAALEPKDKIPENKQVSLMIEHKGKEFLLCTLEYERVMQVNLDLQFSKGEETFFFVSGEGTIHLSGYLDIDTDEVESFAGDMSNSSQYCAIENQYEVGIDSDDEEEDDDNDESKELGTSRLLTLDDSEDEDSDWQPEIEEIDDQMTDEVREQLMKSADKQNTRRKRRVNFEDSTEVIDSDVVELDENVDEDIDEEEMSSSDVDEEISEDTDEEQGKRKKIALPGSSSKRTKQETPAFDESTLSTNKKKRKLATTQEDDTVEETNAEAEVVNSDDDDDDDDDDKMNSSIGRTPMPSKKYSFLARTPKSGLKASGRSENKQQSATLSENGTKSEQKYSKKLPSGVEMEDLRVGNGPVAKKGKFVHVYYVGRLTNNRIFDSLKPSSNKPLSFRLGRSEVIAGWDQGIEGMKVGGKRQLKIPPNMGYGKKRRGPIPPNSTLLFTVELKAVS